MSYALSAGSRARMAGVHPDLVRVVERAIALTPVDFRVIEGRRTRERQAELFKAGASHTMHSRHLTGHAVDLVALVAGKVRWDWALYVHIATAMQKAAEDLSTPVRWGGTWKLLNDAPAPTMSELHKQFPDGPHFELVS